MVLDGNRRRTAGNGICHVCVAVRSHAGNCDKKVSVPDSSRVIGDAGDLDIPVRLDRGVADSSRELVQSQLTVRINGTCTRALGGGISSGAPALT